MGDADDERGDWQLPDSDSFRDKARPSHAQRADALKERVYVTFTAFAVCLTLGQHSEETTVAEASATLALTVVGTLLAVFLADVIAHIAIHSILPNTALVRHLATVSAGRSWSW
ncbi:hypothetical protein NB037_01920 [Rathayibacter sp. ZW T2_19]|uniref:Uncharacterized protein n=1 Tax=Rathayibacter rubneri TaxID=2950106 RepID=A0A9X2DU80_9MICO|nr:hypothetical protein [Rathayibacter rubneri]MCM6761165.1 hypothetical protein [Rathayibacter rubneri]